MLPRRSKLSVLIFLLPPLVIYGVAVLLPIVQSLFLSFFSWDGISDRTFVGIDNYRRMFTGDSVFWTALGNSWIYLGICMVIQLGVGLVVANLLLTLTRGREVIKTLYLLPAIISTVAIAFLFQRIYSTTPPGLLNLVLGWLGMEDSARPWLSDIHTVLAAVSAPEGWRFSGLYMLIIYAGFLSVPKELEEAARVDGASAWQVFSKIRFPYIRPVWYTCIVLAVTYGLRGFDIPYLLTNGGPGQSSELLTTYMYKTAFTSIDYGYASSIAVFIVFECLAAVGFIMLLKRRGSNA